MREVTRITFNRRSKKFNLRIYDEDTGWQNVKCDDADSLVDTARDCLDRADMDALKPKEAAAIRECLLSRGISVPKSLSEQPDGTALEASSRELMECGHPDYSRYNTQVYYVTDIHLDSKISDLHKGPPSDKDVRSVIESAVRNIVDDFGPCDSNKILLIGGDVSADCRITRRFYRKLTKSIHGSKIMAILGNHEYWDERTRKSRPDDLALTSKYYAKMFDKLYISFADDMLFTYKHHRRQFVRGEEILYASVDEIRRFVEDSPLTILGGTGFSGLNEDFNCTNGIYRGAIGSREKEKELSARFESIYTKVLEAVPDSRILVFTHMPMDCWTDKKPCPNWIYVSGHTHRNFLNVSDESRIYSDNQIGYGGTVHLKNFPMSRELDIFRYYPDGIYTITRDQYRDFYRFKNMEMNCSRQGTYTMIKRDSLYCFFFHRGGGLSMLDGGKIRKIDHDLEYYYDNMARYGEAVRGFMKEYQDRLKAVSSLIKSIGGDGRIHGCIVDVDFYNHVYLNPFDGKATPYYATSIVNKYVYPGLEALLEAQREDLLPRYRAIAAQEGERLPATLTQDSGLEGFYGETDIYPISKLFLKMQHLTENFVIRVWNDALLSATDEREWKSFVLGLISDKTEESDGIRRLLRDAAVRKEGARGFVYHRHDAERC